MSANQVRVSKRASHVSAKRLRPPLLRAGVYHPALEKAFFRRAEVEFADHNRFIQGREQIPPIGSVGRIDIEVKAHYVARSRRFGQDFWRVRGESAAKSYCDTLSFNIYGPTIDTTKYGFLGTYDMPTMVSEFHFGALDHGQFFGGMIEVSDQNARGTNCLAYMESAADNAWIVGAHWYQYTDQPATGRSTDGQNGNIGLVDITDTPCAPLIAATRQFGREMYTRRYGSP